LPITRSVGKRLWTGRLYVWLLSYGIMPPDDADRFGFRWKRGHNL